jgi:hypothetical protein
VRLTAAEGHAPDESESGRHAYSRQEGLTWHAQAEMSVRSPKTMGRSDNPSVPSRADSYTH